MRALRVLVVLLVLTLGASACAERAVPLGSGRQNPAARENTINPMSRPQLADGGTLRWPLGSIPPNFNYYHVDGSGYQSEGIIGALMPWVFHTDAAGVPFANPDLVWSVGLTATNPKQVVTYRINPAAVWSDGTPITWADFEAQWHALNGTNPVYQAISYNGYNQIEQVARGADDREVVVTFGRPYADWQAIFSPLYPASTMSSPDVFNTGWKDGPLVTAGPFRFGSVDHTAQTVTLVRNERWWGSHAKLDQIIYRVIPPDAQVDALANGEVDFADIGPDVNKLRRARSIDGVDVRIAAGPNYRQLQFNGRSELLSDLRVRRAIAMSIDRETIARALIEPIGLDPVLLGNHIFMVSQKGYRDNSRVLPYDPEAAAALLDEAGWQRDGDVRRRDGQVLRLRFVIPSDRAETLHEAELVQSMLAEIGVVVAIETTPYGDFGPHYLQPGNFDITALTFAGATFPIGSSEPLFAQPVMRPDGLDVQQNYSRIGSPGIDEMLQRAISELDPDLAAELANAADVMIWEIAHSITVYQRPELVATDSTLANFGAFGFARPIAYEDIGFTRR